MANKKQTRKSKAAALSSVQLQELTKRTYLAEQALTKAQVTAKRYFEGAQLFVDSSDCPAVRKRLQEKLDAAQLAFVEVLAERSQRRNERTNYLENFTIIQLGDTD